MCITEQELLLTIEGCKNQDRASQRCLFETYKGKMFSLCYRYAKSSAEAEDMLQEGFIRVFRYINTYDGSGNFEGWMRRVFINRSISIFHQQTDHNQHFKRSTDEDERHFLEKETFTPIYADHNLLYTEEMMMQSIQNLPPYLRTIFNMAAIDGYTYPEIAKELNLSIDSVKSLMYRARHQIKKTLSAVNNAKSKCNHGY